MTKTTVIHVKDAKRNAPDEVYIGRPGAGQNQTQHFGNPFSHLPKNHARVQVDTRDQALRFFQQWLAGTDWADIEPKRRDWILKNIHTLRGKKLICWCKPQSCHGDTLAELADREPIIVGEEA